MKKNLKNILAYFSPFEWGLWFLSTLSIVLSFCLGGDFHPLTLAASLLGVTALLFLAKGNVIGQFLVIVFSVLYAIVSLEQRFYGEMITYLGMSLPSSAVACVSWLKNPSAKGRSEVKIAEMTVKKWVWLSIASVLVTAAFYFILGALGTNNLIVSTVSVLTSFFASTLMILRSPFYAVAYALNDVVLIVLWISACFTSLSYLPMVFCFVAFLFNDLYGFYSWIQRKKTQE